MKMINISFLLYITDDRWPPLGCRFMPRCLEMLTAQP